MKRKHASSLAIKLSAILLSLVFILSIAPFPALAEDQTSPAGSSFHYEHDPRLNAKAMADIIVDPTAVYGFSPSPEGSLSSYASFDWSDPELVNGENGRLARIAYHESINEMYALKHFPGIGRGTVDSHQDISSIDISKEELKNTDLKPFQEIIRQQGENGFFIMVSHLKYPQLDPDNAASQSRAIMTDLLRKEMGYNGLIITDDLEMGAVAKYGSYRALGVKAVKSGADIVLMCHEYDHVTELYLGLLEAYENGELDKDQIDASVRRIVKAKLMSGITY